MSPQPPNELPDFTRLKQLFDQALPMAPAQREEWLQSECRGNTTLLKQLHDMLSTAGVSFLQNPAQLPSTVGDSGQGTSYFIGPYRLLRELGRGGMGVVYLAVRDDGAFRKNVALKLLLTEMVSPDFIQRFKQERQVVAALDHTHIARILDGGDAPNGMPYYVMEYVEGPPIDKYCDDNRLSLTNRIKSFQQVCQAVHYLHQNLIVHRDLKPSNILVSSDGVVKLLDFGIAKMVGAAAMSSQELTGAQGRPMTPIYASPEQIQGATLQPASDIYSLGVILYKLLTGRTPYDSFDQKVEKLASREDPPLPSANIREELRSETETTQQLRRMMMGGLDNIVLMSMRFDPKKRYQSAAALADDLQQFLDGESITAYHEAYAIRSMKVIKRKRAMLAIAAVMILLAGFGGWQYTSATEARSKLAQLQSAATQSVEGKAADQVFQDVQRLRKVFETDYTTLPASSGGEKQKLLDRGIQYLDKVRSASPTDQRIGLEVAAGYRQLGTLQGREASPKSREKAVATYKKAAAVLVTIAAAYPENTRAKSELDQVNGQLQAWNVSVQVSPSPAPDVSRPQTQQTQLTPPVQHKGQPVSLTPLPNVVSPPPNVTVTPGPDLAVSRAEIEEVQNSLSAASASVQNAEQQVGSLQRNLQAQGQELNAGTLSAKSMMHVKLEQAQRDLDNGNVAGAKASVQAAEAYAARVLKLVGR